MKINNCMLCPRRCGVDRTVSRGYCGAGEKAEISKIMLHHWEEPCISGGENGIGSGAVFFTHCPLGCIYCQNTDISKRSSVGMTVTNEELSDIFLKLQSDGAYNINLVSPTQYSEQIIEAVKIAKANGLVIPVVYNTGGYELPEIIRSLSETVDIFLFDFKYHSNITAKEFSNAENYGQNCIDSLAEAINITSSPVYDENGMMKKGTIVRHLVLPGQKDDSIAILNDIASITSPDKVVLSLMSQYTPDFIINRDDVSLDSDIKKKLKRRITSYEYDKVVDEAIRLGFDGYIQEKTSAKSTYTPDFKK